MSKRRRKRLGQAQHAGDIVIATLSRLGLTDQARRLAIERVWHAALGPAVATHTEILSFCRGVLLVRIAGSTWLQELSYMKESVIERVNGLLARPEVRELRLIAGHFARGHLRPSQSLPKFAPRPLTPEALEEGYRIAHSIEDAEVRTCFARWVARATQDPW